MQEHIVAWNVVRFGTEDGFEYVIRRLMENPVRKGRYSYI